MSPPLRFREACVVRALAALGVGDVADLQDALWPLRRLWWPNDVVAGGSGDVRRVPLFAAADVALRRGWGVGVYDGDGACVIPREITPAVLRRLLHRRILRVRRSFPGDCTLGPPEGAELADGERAGLTLPEWPARHPGGRWIVSASTPDPGSAHAIGFAAGTVVAGAPDGLSAFDGWRVDRSLRLVPPQPGEPHETPGPRPAPRRSGRPRSGGDRRGCGTPEARLSRVHQPARMDPTRIAARRSI